MVYHLTKSSNFGAFDLLVYFPRQEVNLSWHTNQCYFEYHTLYEAPQNRRGIRIPPVEDKEQPKSCIYGTKHIINFNDAFWSNNERLKTQKLNDTSLTSIPYAKIIYLHSGTKNCPHFFLVRQEL